MPPLPKKNPSPNENTPRAIQCPSPRFPRLFSFFPHQHTASTFYFSRNICGISPHWPGVRWAEPPLTAISACQQPAGCLARVRLIPPQSVRVTNAKYRVVRRPEDDFNARVSGLYRGYFHPRVAAAARSSFPPLPARQPQQHGLPVGLHAREKKARNGNVNVSAGVTETGSIDTKRQHQSWHGRARSWRITYKCERGAENFSSRSPVTSLGSVPVSHNPQRVEISERASAARRARLLRAESKAAESESAAAEIILNPLHLFTFVKKHVVWVEILDVSRAHR